MHRVRALKVTDDSQNNVDYSSLSIRLYLDFNKFYAFFAHKFLPCSSPSFVALLKTSALNQSILFAFSLLFTNFFNPSVVQNILLIVCLPQNQTDSEVNVLFLIMFHYLDNLPISLHIMALNAKIQHSTLQMTLYS